MADKENTSFLESGNGLMNYWESNVLHIRTGLIFVVKLVFNTISTCFYDFFAAFFLGIASTFYLLSAILELLTPHHLESGLLYLIGSLWGVFSSAFFVRAYFVQFRNDHLSSYQKFYTDIYFYI